MNFSEERLVNALKWIVPFLRQRGVPFHITGGFAAHLYGAKREVNDIDIDIPNSHLKSVCSEIGEYLEFGPGRHSDSTWDLDVAVLSYCGQLIDLTGDDCPRIFNKNTQSWDRLVMDFEDVVQIEYQGLSLPVQNPLELVSYKLKIQHSEAKHLSDVEAVNAYILNNHLSRPGK